MNSYAIFLCDSEWNIIKPLRLPPDQSLAPGQRLTDWLVDPSPLTDPTFFDGQDQRFVVLQMRDGQQIPALFRNYPGHRLAALAQIGSEEDFICFCRIYERCTAWAQEAFQEYRDEYYQIQQMNNQLINSQRALTKSNARYRQALDEIRKADNLIAILEHDALTDLLRTPALHRKAHDAMAAAPGSSFALLVIDIEPLKLVNEICGRSSGSRLLQDYALFLTGLEHADQMLLARDGGNAFVVFAPGELDCPQKLQTLTEAFLRNYPLPVRLLSKFGICTAAADGITSEEMYDRARLALDTIRSGLHSAAAFYNEQLHAQILLQHKVLDSIQDALRQHQLQLYLQPKVRLNDGSAIGAEALVRWFHPEMGFVSPGDFIPILEREGSIYAVDRYIWEQACRVLAARREQGLSPLPISINAARSDFYQPDLLDVLQALLKKYDLPANLLHLEILERAYTKDSSQLFTVLTALRRHGFRIEMDDFGVGESSLAMLTELPVDIIKLDRQFLISTLKDPRHAEVIRCIIQLAEKLGIGVIAEGVETPEQAQLLRRLGCAQAQGYLYGKPQPAENFMKLD